MKENIDIVIATYNGANYIKEQLVSIINCKGFDHYINRIIISDDHSTDSTVEVINSIDCEQLLLVQNDKNNAGVISNFSHATEMSEADYIIFCDQDDVWLDNKIEVLANGISELEKSENTPALFFTDLYVVDQNLNTIASSFWKYQNIKPKISDSLNSILFQNVSPGCAMIANKALVNLASPFPCNILMHDWWLLIVAKSLGVVAYTNEKTFLYRQHGGNVVGAKNMTFLNKIIRLITNKNDTFMLTLKQVEMLNKILPIEHPDKKNINQIVNIKSLGKIARVRLFKSIFDSNQRLDRSLLLFLRIITYR